MAILTIGNKERDMKQANLFTQIKRNDEMEKQKRVHTRSLTQEEVVELTVWLTQNAEQVNNKTLLQIERVLRKHGFKNHPPKALVKCLKKFGIDVKPQPRKKRPIKDSQEIKRLQEKVIDLETQLLDVRTMVLDLSQVMVKSQLLRGETRRRMEMVRNNIREALDDAAQRNRQQCEIYTDARRDCVGDVENSAAVESSDEAVSLTTRLANTNAGDPIRNTDNQNGG